MRNRNHRVEIYFTKNELETLTKKVRRSGLSREGFCRRVLNALGLMDVPQLRKALDENRVVEKLIVDAYTTSSD